MYEFTKNKQSTNWLNEENAQGKFTKTEYVRLSSWTLVRKSHSFIHFFIRLLYGKICCN